nr:hypothetical protein [Planctopirus ephydatiae]
MGCRHQRVDVRLHHGLRRPPVRTFDDWIFNCEPIRPLRTTFDPVGDCCDFGGFKWFARFGHRRLLAAVRDQHLEKLAVIRLPGFDKSAVEHLVARLQREFALAIDRVMATHTATAQNGSNAITKQVFSADAGVGEE